MKTRYKVLIVLVLVLGILIAAGMVAHVILSIDEPPSDVADLEVHRVDVADDENGYTYLREATKVRWWPGHKSGVAYAEAGYPDEPGQEEDPVEMAKAERLEKIAAGDDWDDALVDEVLSHNGETFALIEKALACPHFQGPRILSFDADISGYYDWLSLMRLQAVRAWLLFKHGQEKAAFDEALNIVRMGHRIQSGKVSLGPYQIGARFKGQGLDLMRQMRPATGLNSKQLKGYAEALSAYDDDGDALAETLRVEFQLCMGTLQELLDGKLTTDRLSIGERLQREWFDSVLKPNQTRRFFAEAFRPLVESAAKPYAEKRAIKPVWREEKGTVRNVMFILSGDLCGIMLSGGLSLYADAIEQKSWAKTELAATRVLLAMKAFRVEKSRLPETLDELVPEYLDAVPLDDFDGKPLRYSAEKKVIYSVGKDLVDDGGMAKEEQKGWWIEENPGWNEEEYGEPDMWRMPDPSFPIEF